MAVGLKPQSLVAVGGGYWTTALVSHVHTVILVGQRMVTTALAVLDRHVQRHRTKSAAGVEPRHQREISVFI